MKQTVTIEQVKAAIAQLRENGERVSRKNVIAITGGSMSTVHRLLVEIEEAEARAAAAPPAEGIDERVQSALLNWIRGRVDEATGGLESKILRLEERETEALESLNTAELRIDALTEEVADAKAQADQERQTAKEAAAAASAKIVELEKVITELRRERQQLIETGAAARTESAKAQLQVERADEAAKKAEAQLHDLGKQLPVAQRAAAVAEQHAQDLAEALAKTEVRVHDLENRIEDLGKANRDLEKALAAAGKEVEYLRSRVDELTAKGAVPVPPVSG